MKYKTKKLVQGIGINDYGGETHRVVNGKQIIPKFYKTWLGMLMRCYNSKTIKRKPTYIGCTVHEEWHSLSKFKEWFDDNYIEGWALDKDLLVKGNRVYGPDTCAFLPPRINTLIAELKRDDLLPGVTKKTLPLAENERKPRVRYYPTAYEKFKTCETELEAHLIWKKDKHRRVLELIEEYPMLSERAKEALRNRYKGDEIYVA